MDFKWTYNIFLAIFALSIALGTPKVYLVVPALQSPPEARLEALQTVQAAELPKDDWPGNLKDICSCESWGVKGKEPRQFDELGNVLIGKKNPNDTGACQIHRPTWEKKALELGYNIWTRKGNIAMAKWIYEREGSKPWNWSAKCWK